MIKVGDLVKVQGKHGQVFVGIIVKNAGFLSFTDGGWIVCRDGRNTLCDKIDMEVISESR
tara:strand:- start:320 stop:499 length:180 start_codon:yes stop_codon:yes gene_type:complete